MTTSSTEPQVIFEDRWMLAVNKVAGMPVQPDTTNDGSLLDQVQKKWPGVGLVHRLDRPVSGVVLFALMPASLRALNAAFRERQVQKTYWAVVHGTPPRTFHREDHVHHDTRNHRARIVEKSTGDPVAIHVRVLSQGDRYALVEVRPEGGSFHQIRVQLAASGHSIKGDVKYGARRAEKDRSIALHARQVILAHPITKEELILAAPVPEGGIWSAFPFVPEPIVP